jgi:hypothetical protein
MIKVRPFASNRLWAETRTPIPVESAEGYALHVELDRVGNIQSGTSRHFFNRWRRQPEAASREFLLHSRDGDIEKVKHPTRAVLIAVSWQELLGIKRSEV